MIDFTSDIHEDLEKTQRLPVLTAEAQLDEALQRERAERIEIVELRLFEVCGALKDTLSKVLNECRARHFALDCGSAAGRMLEDSCHKLEQILSAPGFPAPTASYADTSYADTAQKLPLAFRSIPVIREAAERPGP